MSTDFGPASGSAGTKRMNEIAVQNRAEVANITEGLVNSLGRPATPVEQILAELIAATIVRGRRVRDKGANDSLERAELAALVLNSPWYCPPVPSAAGAK